jgi:RHS repeat-associated protein
VPGGSSGGGWRHYRIRLADFLSQSGTITIPAAYSFSKLILFNDDDGTGSGNSVSRFRNVLLYEGASPLGDVLASDVLYTYDAAGHRVARGESSPNTLPPQTEYFVYDGSQLTMTFAGSTGGSPVLAHRYLYGPAGQVLVDEVFETVGGQRVSDEVLWLLADHQGTVRDVVDSDGVLRKHVEYDAFGRITQEEFYAENGSPISAGHAEAVDQLFYYTGQDRDATTDLQLHGARWYDPATARWLSEDPIAFDGGDPNLYRYAGNSALNFTDPTGLSQAGNPLSSLPGVSKPFANVNYAAPSPQATLNQADQYFANQRSSRSVNDPLYVAPSFTGPKRSTAPLPSDSHILSNYFNDPRYQAIQRAEDDAYTWRSALKRAPPGVWNRH